MRRAAGHRPARGRHRPRLRVTAVDRRRRSSGLAADLRRRPRLVAEPAADELTWACSTTTGSSRGCRDEEVSAQLRERGRRAPRARRSRASTPLDLSQTTWPEFPPPDVVNAITYAARRGLHRYLDAHAERAARRAGRAATASSPTGSSSATAPRSCCSAAAQALLEPGRRARHAVAVLSALPADGAPRRAARAVPVPGFGVDAVLARGQRPHTRVVALCNPNDPTGELLARRRARRAARRAARARRRAARRGAARLRRRRGRATPRSRCSTTTRGCSSSAPSRRPGAWPACAAATRSAARAPSRCSSGSRPPLGLGELAQAGALEALRRGADVVARRARAASPPSAARLLDALRAAAGRRHPEPGQRRLAGAPGHGRRRARRAPGAPRVLVAARAARSATPRPRARGDPGRAATDRLLRALEHALGWR